MKKKLHLAWEVKLLAAGEFDSGYYFIDAHTGELPDRDKNDSGCVHVNGGIPNKVSYLIISGGTHFGIPVQGISRKKLNRSNILLLLYI